MLASLPAETVHIAFEAGPYRMQCYHAGYERYLYNVRVENAGSYDVRLVLAPQAYSQPSAPPYQASFDLVQMWPVATPPDHGGYHLPLAGWICTGESVAMTDAAGNEGDASGCRPGVRMIGMGATMKQEILNFAPGQAYTAAFVGEVSGADTVGLLEMLDMNGNATTTIASGNVTSTTGFRRTAADFTAPAAGHRLFVRLSVAAGTARSRLYGTNCSVAQRWPQQVQEDLAGLSMLRFVNSIYGDPTLRAAIYRGTTTYQDLADGIKLGRADAVLAASIFHYGQHTVQEAKRFMAQQGIPMRLA